MRTSRMPQERVRAAASATHPLDFAYRVPLVDQIYDGRACLRVASSRRRVRGGL